MFGSAAPNLGPITVPVPADNLQQTADALPQMAQRRGMFGNLSINPGNAIAGFMAGMYPKYADSFLAPMMQRQRIQGEMMAQERLQGLEFQRQLALAQQAAQLKMYESPLAQTLLAQGIRPGDPRWDSAMQQSQNIQLNPVVNAGPYGPVVYNQVAAAANAKPLTDADITAHDGQGGQTPPASGSFRY